jgi:aminoglycoside 6-adenylyltransferase
MIIPDYEPLKAKIIVWAKTQPAIRAVILVGSQARLDHPADEWADLDLQVFATDFSPYLSSTGWLDNFGTVWVCIPYQPADSEPQRLALFEGGYKVDFHFFPMGELLSMVQAQTLDEVYCRGYDPILDKDGLAAQLPPPSKPSPHARPAEDVFLSCINLFWYGAWVGAKAIRRRDLWFVKAGDWRLKGHLLEMMEWHAQSLHGWDYDTWYGGKYLTDWIDPQSKRSLDHIFGHFDSIDSWRALSATLDLFRRLAQETAQRLGYAYPAALDERVTLYVEMLYRRDNGSSDPHMGAGK